MPSMDFLYDIIEKLSEEDIDYIIVSIRKGKTQDKADLFYRISDESTDTANALLKKISSLVNETVVSTTTENKEIDEEAAGHEKRNSTNEFINKIYEIKKVWKECAEGGMYEKQCVHEMSRLDEMMKKLGA